MKKKIRLTAALLLILAILLACITTGEAPAVTTDVDDIATSVAATLAAQDRAETEVPPTEQSEEPTQAPEPTAEPTLESTEEAGVLLHSLYFLRDTSGIFQVWRIEKDGVTTTQITFEPADVDSFDVNRFDGSVAYVSENKLLLVKADGSDRRVLVDGGPETGEDDFYWTSTVSTPRFSPVDTNRLAFALNGLNIYDLSSGTYHNLINNVLNNDNPSFVFVEELYFPNKWSPDGTKLLLDLGWYEGGTFGVWDFNTNILTDIVWPGIVCCEGTWAPDSNSFVVASPYLGMIESGMWRFDANTGAGTALLETPAGDGTFNYAGWAIQLPDDSLRFFYHNSPAMVEGDVILHLVSSGLDASTNLVPLLPDNFDIYEALWTMNGRQVVVVQRPGGGPAYPQIGPLVLYDIPLGVSIPLSVTGMHPVWGP